MSETLDRENSALRKEVRVLTRKLEQCQRNRRELGYVKDKLDHVLVREEDARVEIERSRAEVVALAERLEAERSKTEAFLESLLPSSIVAELREKGRVEPRVSSCATVLFADFTDFGSLAMKLPPADLVGALDSLFSAFDQVADRHGLEPLKTLGDSYRCVGGLFAEDGGCVDHASQAVEAALQMIAAAREYSRAMSRPDLPWALRVGIHTGPLVSGLVGRRKVNFDVWGETVSIAARFKELGEGGRVNVSRTTADACMDRFFIEPRGWLEVKHRGPMEMFFVDGRDVSSVRRTGSG